MTSLAAASSIRLIGLIFNDELFGQELANIAVYRALQEDGSQLRVGSQFSSRSPEVSNYLCKQGLHSFRLPYGCQWSKTFFKRTPSLLFKNIAAIRNCSRILREEILAFKPTHLMISDSLIYSYIFPSLRKKSFEFVFRTGDLAPVESKPQLFIWRNCIRHADKIVVNSKFVMESVLRNAGSNVSSKTTLIYNFPPNGDPGYPRYEAVSQRRPVIMYAGQISEHKGVRHFIDAAIALCDEMEQVDFWIVGGSTHTSQLESELKLKVRSKELEGRIFFLGKVQDPGEFYRSADLLVVPTISEEPAANVVLEAMSFGVPSVVYQSGGLPELVRHDETGIVCRQRATSALVEELKSLLRNPGKIASMRENCLIAFGAQFGKERFVREWKNVLLKT